jgi:hypothetical protein
MAARQLFPTKTHPSPFPSVRFIYCTAVPSLLLQVSDRSERVLYMPLGVRPILSFLACCIYVILDLTLA